MGSPNTENSGKFCFMKLIPDIGPLIFALAGISTFDFEQKNVKI